jgi:hypothetical protein
MHTKNSQCISFCVCAWDGIASRQTAVITHQICCHSHTICIFQKLISILLIHYQHFYATERQAYAAKSRVCGKIANLLSNLRFTRLPIVVVRKARTHKIVCKRAPPKANVHTHTHTHTHIIVLLRLSDQNYSPFNQNIFA